MYSDFSFCPWLGRGLPALLRSSAVADGTLLAGPVWPG